MVCKSIFFCQFVAFQTNINVNTYDLRVMCALLSLRAACMKFGILDHLKSLRSVYSVGQMLN